MVRVVEAYVTVDSAPRPWWAAAASLHAATASP